MVRAAAPVASRARAGGVAAATRAATAAGSSQESKRAGRMESGDLPAGIFRKSVVDVGRVLCIVYGSRCAARL